VGRVAWVLKNRVGPHTNIARSTQIFLVYIICKKDKQSKQRHSLCKAKWEKTREFQTQWLYDFSNSDNISNHHHRDTPFNTTNSCIYVQILLYSSSTPSQSKTTAMYPKVTVTRHTFLQLKIQVLICEYLTRLGTVCISTHGMHVMDMQTFY